MTGKELACRAAACVVLVCEAQFGQGFNLRGNGVGENADTPAAADGHDGDGQGIVAADDDDVAQPNGFLRHV